MRQLSRWFFVALLPLLLVLVVPAAAGKLTPKRSVPTSGEVTGLAFYGARVVYGIRPYGVTSQSVHVWNVLSGRGSVIHRRGGGASFAVATNRVAWIARAGSPSETDEYLLTTPLPSLHLRQVAFAMRSDDHEAQSEEGDWLSGLAGSGNAIAVSSWTTGSDNSLSNGRLSLVGTNRLKPIASGPGAIVVESADAGRIAVVRSMALWPSHYRLSGGAGSVAVYSTSGKLLVEVARGTAKEAALSGNTLAILTTTNRIELYNAKTGAFARSWPVPLRSAHLDLQAGIAIYSVYGEYAGPRALHVLQLKTGKDVVLGRGAGPYPYGQGDDAQIDRLGVVYAVNKWPGTPRGHIVFVPMARVIAAVSKGHASGSAQVAASSGSAAAPKRNGDILYGSIRVKNGSRLLYVMQPNGTHQRRIGVARNVWSPAWSPGGRWIAYGATPRNGGLCPQLYLMRSDGSHTRRLKHARNCYLNPTWAPGGKRIAFEVGGGTATPGIWTMNVDGSGLRLLTDKGNTPAWSPDGKTIAFRSTSPKAIWLMDADGSNLRQLTTPLQRPRAQSDSDAQPAWSPNGKWIAFSRRHPPIERGNPTSSSSAATAVACVN